MLIRPLQHSDFSEWLRMRLALWPECSEERHLAEMAAITADQGRQAVFVATRGEGPLCGFVEVSIHSHALGCDTNTVGYVEGWWVADDVRRTGVGRLLLREAENWARKLGCQEMASDCHANNGTSLAAHTACGYRPAGQLIHFAKTLKTGP